MSKLKIFSGLKKDNIPQAQLLPRDILEQARMFSGEEVLQQISKAATEFVTYARVNYSDPIGTFALTNPINVANGDTIEFTWTWHNPENDHRYVSPQKIIFYSTGSGSVYTKRVNG